MSSERPINPRFDEDLPFNQVAPGPARYRTRTDKPVRYFEVVDKQDATVLGYVWACDEDDAAAWEPRQSAGPKALVEGSAWHALLTAAKGRDLPPSQVLAELYGDPEAGIKGLARQGSLTGAPNADTVKALAKNE